MAHDSGIEDDSGVASETSSLISSSPNHSNSNELYHEEVQLVLTEPDYGSISAQDHVSSDKESLQLLNASSDNNFLRTPSVDFIRRKSQDIIRRMSQCVIIKIPTTTWEILSKTWIWNFTMFLSYLICLSIFPSIIALVQSTYSDKVRIDQNFRVDRQALNFLAFEKTLSR